MLHIFPSPAGDSAEKVLRLAGRKLDPTSVVENKIRLRVRQRLRCPELLKTARDALAPDGTILTRILCAVRQSIDPIGLSLWERLRGVLMPSLRVRQIVWNHLSIRLEPSFARVVVSRPVKWVAAFALALLVVRVSPLLFLAPASIAESPVLVFATRGNAEILLGSLWQPIRGELALQTQAKIQTQEGEATIIDHDDAVFRLATHTRVSFLDRSDRPEVSKQETTLVLEEGTLWVLGLVPKHIRGITVVMAQGRIVVHEGSVSVSQSGGDSDIRVFNRSAVVWRHGRQMPMAAGEQIALFAGRNLGADSAQDGGLAKTEMDHERFHEPWVATNLSRDAAHQREIAQLQQERRAASAGILPGTTLYGVKRLAERVDVMLSFSSDERARKLITQANTRLNEAAALLQTGGASEAESALREYKDTLLQVASGSGGSHAVRSLIQKEVDGAPATVAAALPGDEAYALKQAVDAAIASLPEDTVETKPDMEGAALLDQLVVVKRQAERGDTSLARENLSALADSIAALGDPESPVPVSSDVLDEARAMASHVTAVIEGPAQGIGLSLGVPAKPFIEPRHPIRSVIIRPITSEQVIAKAQEIRGRIFVFGTKKARYDALEDQLSLIIRHPDRGRILRELSKVLPRDGLAQRVVREINSLSLQVKEVTASGGVAQPQ